MPDGISLSVGTAPGLLMRHARRFGPAYMRGAFYIALAICISFQNTFAKLTPDELEKMSWLQIFCLGLNPVSAGITAAMSFLDQTLARIHESDPEQLH